MEDSSASSLDNIKEKKTPSFVPTENAKLEDEKTFQHLKHHLHLHNTFHKIFIYSVWILFVIGIVMICIRAYHLVAPLEYRWLNDDQLQGIDKILYSGFAGTFLGRYLNKAMKED